MAHILHRFSTVNTLRTIRNTPLPRWLLNCLTIFLFISQTGCGDDTPPGAAPPPNVNRPDAGVQPEPLPPDPEWKEVTCKDINTIDVGRPELGQDMPDHVSLIARPGGSSGFLLAIAEKFCPEPCDGSYGSSFDSKRAMLYPIGPGANADPDEPIMVTEGIGTTHRANSSAPRLALLGDTQLAVAWLDNMMVPEAHAQEVWARILSLSDLSPTGPSFRLSNVEWMARYLHLVGGESAATVIYEDFDPYAKPPAPVLWMHDFSATGASGGGLEIGEIAAGGDSHAAAHAGDGSLLFARTDPPNLLLGAPDEVGEIVQQDPATDARGEISLVTGGVAFGALRSHRSVIVFRPLDENGRPVGNENIVAGDTRTPGISASHPTLIDFRGGFLLTYRLVENDNVSMRGAFLSRSGKVLDDFALGVSLGDNISIPSSALSTDGSTVAVAWKERAGNTNTVRLLRMRCD